MILYGYPLPPCRRTHSAAEQVVRRALFAPSPCSRGVASETRGCGGLVPRKAFSFGNFGQRQAQHRRARRKTAKGRRSTARLGGRRPKGRRSTAGFQKLWPKPGEAPLGFGNLCQGRGRTSRKICKGGFLPLRIFLDTPCRPAEEYTLPQGQVVRRAPFAPSPCPRGVASETGGAGASPRKTFQLQKLWPQSGEAAHFASEAANSREARGGLAISARGVSPQRRRAANAAQNLSD